MNEAPGGGPDTAAPKAGLGPQAESPPDSAALDELKALLGDDVTVTDTAAAPKESSAPLATISAQPPTLDELMALVGDDDTAQVMIKEPESAMSARSSVQDEVDLPQPDQVGESSSGQNTQSISHALFSRRGLLIGSALMVASVAAAIGIVITRKAPGAPPAGPHVRLAGGWGWVTCVVFSPDGRTLASGSQDNTIKLWDITSWQLHQTLMESATALSLAFSPDGRTLALGSQDSTIKLWDVASGQLLAVRPEHSGAVASIAFSSDGRTLASGSADGTIKLWDVTNRVVQRTLSGHQGGVNSIALSPDGQTLASGGRDGTAKLWDLASGSLRQTLSVNSDQVVSVAFPRDGRTFAVGDDDNRITLWDVNSGQLQLTLKDINDDGSGGNFPIAFAPVGRTFAAGSGGNTTKLWDVANGWQLQRLTDPEKIVTDNNLVPPGVPPRIQAVAFSPDGRTLASGSEDSTIRVWDLDNAPVAPLPAGSLLDQLNKKAGQD
jgi:hypothetical protein